MPTYPRRCDFGAILDSRGFQEWPLWAPFSPKKAPKVEYPGWLGAPWSQPGREMAPKTSQNDPRIEFNRFFHEFGLIWDRFSMNFLWFLTCFSIIVCVLFGQIRINIQSRTHFEMLFWTPRFAYFTFDHSVITFRNVDFEWCFMYFQRYKPQPINLKPWPSGMRVSD